MKYVGYTSQCVLWHSWQLENLGMKVFAQTATVHALKYPQSTSCPAICHPIHSNLVGRLPQGAQLPGMP